MASVPVDALALAITIAFGAILLGLFGFDAGEHPDDGALSVAALSSSIDVLRPPETKNLHGYQPCGPDRFTARGTTVLGLALLSLRGRVKR